jgi:hypothetical protein
MHFAWNLPSLLFSKNEEVLQPLHDPQRGDLTVHAEKFRCKGSTFNCSRGKWGLMVTYGEAKLLYSNVGMFARDDIPMSSEKQTLCAQ